MSPSSYLIAVPLGIVATAGLVVRMQDTSFAASPRTAHIQQVARHAPLPDPGEYAEPAMSARLDHGRFGWEQSDPAAGGSTLGDNIQSRPLGARQSGAGVPWLDQPGPAPAKAAGKPLENIPGYIPAPELDTSVFETVPSDSGFHITADEATKMDIQAERVVFNGKVKMTSPQFHLSTTQLVVHLGKDKKSFKFAEAKGEVNVQLTGVPDDKKYRGQSNIAIYTPSQGTLLLTGWPKIQGQGQELIAAESGTKVTLFPKTGKMITEGRAQTRVARQLMAEGIPPKATPVQ